MEYIIIKGLLPRLLEKERAENCTTLEEYMLPLGREESAEVELLPPKMEDIAVAVVVVGCCCCCYFLRTKGEGKQNCARS